MVKPRKVDIESPTDNIGGLHIRLEPESPSCIAVSRSAYINQIKYKLFKLSKPYHILRIQRGAAPTGWGGRSRKDE